MCINPFSNWTDPDEDIIIKVSDASSLGWVVKPISGDSDDSDDDDDSDE